MRVIMFKPQFTGKILSGQKLSTIRPKARCKPGDTLSLRNWEGKPYRSKHKTIMETTCKSIHKIRISDLTITIELQSEQNIIIPIGNVDSSIIAKMEGFDSSHEMLAFFSKTHYLPFEGHMIYWGEKPLPSRIKP